MSCIYCGGDNCGASAGGPDMCENSAADDFGDEFVVLSPRKVSDERPLVSFLYELMRDHVTSGVVEEIMKNTTERKTIFSNGHLAKHAQELADRMGVKR